MNYLGLFHKYFLHLSACIAARKKDVRKVMEIVQEVDGSLRSKVKDSNSPFD